MKKVPIRLSTLVAILVLPAALLASRAHPLAGNAPAKETAGPVLIAQAHVEEPPLPAPEPRKLEPIPEDLLKPQPPQDPDQPIIEFSAEVFEAYVTFFPARSTLIGIKSSQSALGDYRRKSIGAFVGSYKGYLARLDKIPSDGFTEKGKLEKESLRVHIKSIVRLIDTVGAPYHDPNFYVDESVGAIQATIDRDEGNLITRAEHLAARLSLLRYFFSVARENLESCPRPAVRRAIMRLRSAGPLFERTVPDEIRLSGHPDATKTGPGAATAAWKETIAFADWLEKERLPKAPAPAPLGAKGWQDWLASRETGALTPAQVVAAAEADLARLKDQLVLAAGAIDVKLSPAEHVARIEAAQQEPSVARANAPGLIDRLWGWIVKEKPMDPPSDQDIMVRDATAFRRRDVPVRANLPGAYAGREAPAWLEIGAPDPEWPPAVMGPWLSSYGTYFLPWALAREVYPGRFTAWQRTKLSRIRACKAVEYPTMTEGWTLFAEELAMRSGFSAGDKQLRLAALLDLVRADARLVASVRLHTMNLPAPEATAYLAREGYWPRDVASMETERLLAEPDAVAACLGRLEIAALRDDVGRIKGDAFNSGEFLNRLISFGSAPVSALRQAVFPGTGNALLGAVK